MLKKPIEKESPILELYGACAKIQDGPTKDLLLNAVMDGYIDLWYCNH